MGYNLVLQVRGGKEVTELPWTTLTWGRRLDDMSSASATVPVADLGHPLASLIRPIDPWAHEIAVWRDSAKLWEGPIVETEWSPLGLLIQARDMWQWLERRTLPTDRTIHGADLATIFRVFFFDAISPSSPRFSISTLNTGITGARAVRAADRHIAADEMRELARDGLDFTVIRRNLFAGRLPDPKLSTLMDDMCVGRDSPKVNGAGLLRATKVWVVGATLQGATTPVLAGVGNLVEGAGLIERVFSEPSILDHASAVQAAVQRLTALRYTPYYMTADLIPSRCPPIDSLVPGATWPVEASPGVFRMERTLRLAGVDGGVQRGSNGVAETLTVTLVPPGEAG